MVPRSGDFACAYFIAPKISSLKPVTIMNYFPPSLERVTLIAASLLLSPVAFPPLLVHVLRTGGWCPIQCSAILVNASVDHPDAPDNCCGYQLLFFISRPASSGFFCLGSHFSTAHSFSAASRCSVAALAPRYRRLRAHHFLGRAPALRYCHSHVRSSLNKAVKAIELLSPP